MWLLREVLEPEFIVLVNCWAGLFSCDAECVCLVPGGSCQRANSYICSVILMFKLRARMLSFSESQPHFGLGPDARLVHKELINAEQHPRKKLNGGVKDSWFS